ncbi:MAG: iron ABC transporter permease [Anaerolineae bacterium]|nr:iron ABC transporter permease [Anaerolineae bacterium]
MTETTTLPTWPRLGIRPAAVLLLLAGLVGCFLLSLTLGSVKIPLPDILTILMGGEPARATWTTIVWQFRLPKALTAVLAGAALSVSGLQMQTLFRNPLAGPSVLGVNAGASLGVALVVLATGVVGANLLAGLGVRGDVGIVVAASLGAGLALALVLAFARRVETMTLMILGLLFSYGVSALVSILLYFAIPERIQAYISWTFGSFGGVTWSQMRLMLPLILAGLLLAGALAKSLNALLLGENYAQTLGLEARRVRWWVVLSTAVLSATVTVFCGPIIFLDVAVPHLCRALFGTSDHRILIPTCILLGATIALLADLIAQLPGSQLVLPLNSVMALIGVPVVMWVILRRGVTMVGSG